MHRVHRYNNVRIFRTTRASPRYRKGAQSMPRLLHYVSGVRFIVDPFDHRLWHFTIRGKRYQLRERSGGYMLQDDDDAPLGRFTDWGAAVAAAREHMHAAVTERIPVIPPHLRRGAI